MPAGQRFFTLTLSFDFFAAQSTDWKQKPAVVAPVWPGGEAGGLKKRWASSRGPEKRQ